MLANNKTMTKKQALKFLKDYARAIVKPELAENVAEVFDLSLETMEIKPKSTKDFQRANYSTETAELKGVSIHELAWELAYRVTGKKIKSRMYGVGSGAEDIVKQAIAILNV